AAASELEEATRLDPSQPQPFAYLAYAYSKLGDRQSAGTLLSRLQTLAKTRYVSGYLFAVMYAGSADTDQAMRALERAYQDRDDMVTLTKGECVFNGLHSDPRFQSFLARLRL